MNATVNVLCYKSKTLSNGEHPLVIRICKDGKKKYQSIGVSVKAENWDFNKNQPKRSCPNREAIQQIILQKTAEYRNQILDFKLANKDFTTSTLVEKINGPQKAKTVHELFDIQIERLKSVKRLNYALTYKYTLSSLLKFNKHLDIHFSDIDVSWLKKYENWLRTNDLKSNTIAIYFRTLRTLYNLAIEEGIVKREYYPFNKFNVAKLSQKTAKRAIRKDDVLLIINYKPNSNVSPYSKLAIDIFTFSYFMGGINFVDIAHLTNNNIIDNQLSYIRKKTKKLISLPLQDKATELINKYSSIDNPYLFPILNSFHKTDQQKVNRVHKVIAKVNKRLKEIGKELNIPIDLTTYVARHSFATVLKRSGVSTSIISESLGHSSEKVTQYYLDSFGNEQMNEAMKNLL